MESAFAQAGALLSRVGPRLRALVGFDGFIDTIIDAVDTRHDMSPTGYTRIATIRAFARRCGAEGGHSTNIELVDRERRWGGNGPLLAGALGVLGMDVTCIGAVGDEEDPFRIHALFGPLVERCTRVVPIAPPGRTDAIEFDDGKLMFNRTAPLAEVTWETLQRRVGESAVRDLATGSRLIGLTNWSLVGGVEEIWRRLAEMVRGRDVRFHVDISDPAKRSDADVRRLVSLLRSMNDAAPLTLSLNVAEARRLAQVLGVACAEGAEPLAHALADSTGLDTVAVHCPAETAAVQRGRSACVRPHAVDRPAISTGAGDHFGAGLAFAQAHGWPIDAALAMACAVATEYVRTGRTPSRRRVVRVLATPDGA